jgi:hypothetical protein
VKTRLRTAVRAIVRAETPETIAAEIAAAQEEARTARAESERLATLAATELNDDAAEEALRQSRSQDRAARRAEARIDELRERLAAAQWQQRDRAFRRHQKELAKLVQRVVETMREAVEANAALATARHTAIGEVGTSISVCPGPYLGIPLADLFGTWRRQAERQLKTLESASLPPPPPAPGAAPVPIQPLPVPAKPPVAVVPQPVPAPVPPPVPASRPKRQLRRDPAPPPGFKQVHIMRNDVIDVGDGTQAGLNDRVNLPEDNARRLVETGVGNYVDIPIVPAAKPEAVGMTEAANA